MAERDARGSSGRGRDPRRAFVAAALVAVGAILAVARAEDPAPAVAPARPFRDIRVRLACDQPFREMPGWELVARRRVAQASETFEKAFSIRWTVVDVVPWTSDPTAMTLDSMLDAVAGSVPREGADVVIGFTGRTGGLRASDDFEAAGIATYFGPSAVVRRCFPEATEAKYVETLTHEMGHVMGAWHSSDPASVMHGGSDGEPRTAFDPQSAAMIELMRDGDLSRGAGGLDDARRRRIDAIFRSGHAADADLPYAWCDVVRARALVDDPRTFADGQVLARHAIAAVEACAGPNDPSLLGPLRALAWADIRHGAPADVDEAERLVSRFRAIVVGSEHCERPLLESAAMYACVAAERGRTDDGRILLSEVLAARHAALGPEHPATTEVAALKRWCEGRPAGAVRPAPWTESRWTAAADAASASFDFPPPGAFHVRPVALVSPWTAGPGVDAVREFFAVAVPSSGSLTVEFRQIDAPGATSVVHRVSARLDGTSCPFVPPTFGFGYSAVAGGPEDRQEYFVEMQMRPSGNAARWTLESFRASVPRSAPARVLRVPESPDSRFLALRCGTTLFRGWQWVGERPKPTISFEGDAAAIVDGVRVTPDGAGAQCTWRLEVTFVPDAPK
jgi:hypothetical protein